MHRTHTRRPTGTWRHRTRQAVCGLGLVLGIPAAAQSIDTSSTRATVGEPVAMTLRVRAFDWPASHLSPDCLDARLQQGEQGADLGPLRLRTAPTGEDGVVLVHLSSPGIVHEPVLQGRLMLRCGAEFMREFTVLADPSPEPRPRLNTRSSAAAALRPAVPTESLAAPRPTATTERITRSDDPAPTPRAAAPAWNDHDLARLAHLVAEALQPAHPSASAVPPAGGTEFPWQDLRAEQQQARAQLAALQSRLDRAERDPWRDAAIVAGTLAGLSLSLLAARSVREATLPRWRSAEQRRTADHPPPGTPQTAPPQTQPQPSPTPPPPAPAEPAARTGPWPAHADFGHPTLDTLASAALRDELAAYRHTSPISCVVALEEQLQDGSAKCPWILLDLLDLYDTLEQPWNHERVAAQLGALYNVDIDLHAPRATRGTGEHGLTAHPAALAQALSAWQQADSATALGRLLMRDTSPVRLDLPAFEEVLLLHSLALRLRTASDATAAAAPESGDASADWTLLAAA